MRKLLSKLSNKVSLLWLEDFKKLAKKSAMQMAAKRAQFIGFSLLPYFPLTLHNNSYKFSAFMRNKS